jgi:hypothetical protein
MKVPTAISSFSWRSLWPGLAVVSIFAALTAGVTYPLVTQLESSVAQNPRWSRDAFQQVYELWWYKQALLDLHANPGYLRWIYFPTGADYPLILTYSTVYAVGIPFLLFLSPVATYNVLFLLTFFLSGLSGYALCTYLTRNRWAGLLGGIVYAFFPGRIAHALSGHLELIATYLFPLYFLLLIKTVRQPRWTTALLCGLALAGSLLVQPLFIPFLLVPITLTWLLCETVILKRPIERRALIALGGAFGLAVLIAAPLFWPVLRQQAAGHGAYLQDIGVVRFSGDLLGIISPSPVNPVLEALGLIPAYASRVAPPDWRIAELLIYAGVVPLALGILGAVSQRRKLSAWTLVAIFAAGLSLGPVLKVGGRVVTFTADDVESTVALPYALLVNLPLLSLNRAPARINTTLMLALAVLSAHGLDWLMARLHRARRGWRYGIAGALCAITLAELLVVWPCPTTPLSIPAYLAEMARQPAQGGVLNLPVAAGHVEQTAVLYQTIHRYPVFDSWFQRALPVFPDVAGFLDGLLSPSEGSDIFPEPPVGARAAVARATDVDYVFLFTRYVGYADAKMERLAAEFGPPRSVEHGVAIYQVGPGPDLPDGPVYALPNNDWRSPQAGWHDPERWGGRPARWLTESADLFLYSPDRQTGALRFTALPYLAPQRLQVEVNGTPLAPLVIGEWITYTTPSFDLEPGVNQLTLRALNGCDLAVGDPRCSGVSLAVAQGGDSECAPYIDSERCLSILFQDVRFVGTETAPASQTLDITLGGQVRLVGYDLSGDPAPGRALGLTLYWRALEAVAQDYTIFVHLLGPGRELAVQHDAPPLNGVHPTSRWLVGDIYTEHVTLPLPQDIQPGRYDLVVGMYSYPDIIRLPVASDRPYAQDGLIWLQHVDLR